MPAYRDEKHGTFYASFYYTDFTGARRKKMKRGFKLKRDAQEWERQFLLQRNADPDMKFGDFVEIYRSDKRERIREHTWESKDNMINTKILPYFKDRTLSEIEPRDVIAWQNTLMSIRQKNGKPYSPTYLKSIHKLSVVGRDQQDQELTLNFDHERCIWKLVKAETEVWRTPPDPVLEAVAKLVTPLSPVWSGRPSELQARLPDTAMLSHVLTRYLNVNAERLFNEYGIAFESKRTHDGRLVTLTLTDPTA